MNNDQKLSSRRNQPTNNLSKESDYMLNRMKSIVVTEEEKIDLPDEYYNTTFTTRRNVELQFFDNVK